MEFISYKDQMGREVLCPSNPCRIISLVPSITELLFDLGLGEKVVGRTKFCILPEDKVSRVAVIGGTKQFRMNVIEELQPDLIIGNKEENTQEEINKLEAKYPVWMSDVQCWDDMEDLISQLGNITRKSSESSGILLELQELKCDWKDKFKILDARIAYLIWREPYMAAASGTYIDSFLKFLGFRNAFEHLNRYPEIQNLNNSDDITHVLLSSEPYPFSEKHFEEVQTLFPRARILLVDGMFFSWYGSRLLHMKAYINELNSLILGTN